MAKLDKDETTTDDGTNANTPKRIQKEYDFDQTVSDQELLDAIMSDDPASNTTPKTDETNDLSDTKDEIDDGQEEENENKNKEINVEKE